jgi:hypothetical protein
MSCGAAKCPPHPPPSPSPSPSKHTSSSSTLHPTAPSESSHLPGEYPHIHIHPPQLPGAAPRAHKDRHIQPTLQAWRTPPGGSSSGSPGFYLKLGLVLVSTCWADGAGERRYRTDHLVPAEHQGQGSPAEKEERGTSMFIQYQVNRVRWRSHIYDTGGSGPSI